MEGSLETAGHQKRFSHGIELLRMRRLLTFSNHVRHSRVHVRKLEHVPSEGNHAQREVMDSHTPLARSGRVEDSGLDERILPVIKPTGVLERYADCFVRVDRAELHVRRGAFVEVAILRRDAEPCPSVHARQ